MVLWRKLHLLGHYHKTFFSSFCVCAECVFVLLRFCVWLCVCFCVWALVCFLETKLENYSTEIEPFWDFIDDNISVMPCMCACLYMRVLFCVRVLVCSCLLGCECECWNECACACVCLKKLPWFSPSYRCFVRCLMGSMKWKWQISKLRVGDLEPDVFLQFVRNGKILVLRGGHIWVLHVAKVGYFFLPLLFYRVINFRSLTIFFIKNHSSCIC